VLARSEAPVRISEVGRIGETHTQSSNMHEITKREVSMKSGPIESQIDLRSSI
jgi:hypothetical protein